MGTIHEVSDAVHTVNMKIDPEITASPMTPTSNKVEVDLVTDDDTKNDSSISKSNIKKEEEEKPKLFTADEENSDDDEYVDDDYEGVAEDETGTEYFICKEMKIPRIPPAVVKLYRLGDLYSNSKTKYMNLVPAYQREVVWDEHRSSELIKSILIRYFIPPLIFNVIGKMEPDGKGGKEKRFYRICVDGKQRMTSVIKFMDGQIGVYDASHPPKKWYYRHPIVNGVEKITSHNIMPDVVKKEFRDFKFVCHEYYDLSLRIEETMFQLVQRGIALTPAERMRAMSTEWAEFTKKYEEDYSLVVNLSKQNRASGFRTVLTIFTMIQEVMARAEQGKTGTPTLQSSPQALNKVLNDKEPISESLKFEFKEVFDKFEALVKACSTHIGGTWVINSNTVFHPAPDFLQEQLVNHVKTYSPLELLATGILLAKHMGDRSDDLLLGDIKEMRHYLREKHRDLRVNAQCWVTTWEFLDVELLRRRGGPGGTPMPDLTAEEVEETAATTVASPETSAKHARDQSEDSEEVSIVASAPTKKARAGSASSPSNKRVRAGSASASSRSSSKSKKARK